jgi:hemerythrin-like domain-containing protein
MDLIKLEKSAAKRQAEKGINDEGLSPMDPPEATAPPGQDLFVPYEQMHPYLQALRDEHKECVKELDRVEDALTQMQENGPGEEVGLIIEHFFHFVDDTLLPHNRREEKEFFPLLEQRLRESGEHSKGPENTTGVQVLESEHVDFIRLSSTMRACFGLAGHMPDPRSQRVVVEAGIQDGKAFVEQLRLHIFREDDVLFSLAHKLITSEEFDAMAAKAAK